MRLRTVTRLLLASTLLAGCSGLIGSGGDGDNLGDQDNVGQDPQALCDAGVPNVGEAPLRRMTRVEYNHAVRDLLDIDTDTGLDFVADYKVAGFSANSITSLSESQVDELIDAGEDLAIAALDAHQDDWFGCDLNETDCVEPWLATFARRAFRRALDAELADYVTFHLQIVGCEVCASNLEDLKREQENASGRDDVKERLFASSIGFLKKLK